MSPGKKIADWNLSLGLASKLASVVVHAQELLEEEQRSMPDADALDADRAAMSSAAYDREVQEWLGRLGPIAPLKRSERDREAKRNKRNA